MKNNEAGMSLIVKTITRYTGGLILIYGVYIVLRGHVSPGGGFAGGVIIALSLIQLMLAFGKEAVLKKLSRGRAIFLAGLAALVLLLLSLRGFGAPQAPGFTEGTCTMVSAGLLSVCDIAISVLVGVGLFVAFSALVVSPEAEE